MSGMGRFEPTVDRRANDRRVLSVPVRSWRTSMVVLGENPAELRASHKSFIAAWEPVSVVEAKLVWEITIADWRLRLARHLEPKLVELENSHSMGRSTVADIYLAAMAAYEPGESLEPASDELNDPKPNMNPAALAAAEMSF